MEYQIALSIFSPMATSKYPVQRWKDYIWSIYVLVGDHWRTHLFDDPVIISNRRASYGLSIRENIVEMEKGRGTMPRSVRVVRAGRKYEGGPSRLFRHLCRMVTRICVPVLQVLRQVHLDVPVKKCTYLWLHLASTVSPADRPMVPPLLSRHTLSIHCPTVYKVWCVRVPWKWYKI